MEQNTLPPAKKKSDLPMTQPINKDVMELLSNRGKPKQHPEVEKAKEQIRQYITQYKIDPNMLIQVGQLCSQGLRDPTMYQMAVDMAVKNGIMKKEEVGEGTNYKLLGIGITIGKLTEQLVQEGLK
jgi:hypothetical protein